MFTIISLVLLVSLGTPLVTLISPISLMYYFQSLKITFSWIKHTSIDVLGIVTYVIVFFYSYPPNMLSGRNKKIFVIIFLNGV